MKIDFSENSFSIHLDKAPKLLYFNENGTGCGAVFLNGQRIKLLQTVDIHAQANDGKPHLLSYNIGFYDPKDRESKAIATGESALETITVPIRIMDMLPFHIAMSKIREMFRDERIPKEIREEYANMFLKEFQKTAES